MNAFRAAEASLDPVASMEDGTLAVPAVGLAVGFGVAVGVGVGVRAGVGVGVAVGVGVGVGAAARVVNVASGETVSWPAESRDFTR
jgi:hypothetical protein